MPDNTIEAMTATRRNELDKIVNKRVAKEIDEITADAFGPAMRRIHEGAPSRAMLKWDEDKVKFRLVLPGFLKLMAEILTKGEVNHPAVDGTPSWQLVELEAYEDALMRHLNSWRMGETNDEEMNTHHMGHVAINAMFLWFLDKPKRK